MSNMLKKIFFALSKRMRVLNTSQRRRNAPKLMTPLFEDGILKVSWKDMFGQQHVDSELYRSMKSEIDAMKLDFSVEKNGLKGSFLSKKYAPGDRIKDAGLLSFVHSPEISHFLFQYFGGNFLMLAADYWKTCAHGDVRVGSQNWHTDPEDAIMLKIFVYFSDVDCSNGATEYIRKTQIGGDSCIRSWHAKKLTGYYLDDSLVRRIFEKSPENFSVANGKEGDILFVDTTGLHRGGWGSESRSIANYTFTSTDCKLTPRWMKKDIAADKMYSNEN